MDGADAGMVWGHGVEIEVMGMGTVWGQAVWR